MHFVRIFRPSNDVSLCLLDLACLFPSNWKSYITIITHNTAGDLKFKKIEHNKYLLYKQRQLPTESKLFGNVDKAWRDIMRRTVDRPNALKAGTAPGVLEMLQSSNTSLEKIHKCLEVVHSIVYIKSLVDFVSDVIK